MQLKEVEAAARALNIQLLRFEARGPEDLAKAFAAIAKERVDALLLSRDSNIIVIREKIADYALKGRLPTMFSFSENVEAGGLMSYSVNMVDFIGRAAGYVDKILRGAKPEDLPVELPTQFELVINMPPFSHILDDEEVAAVVTYIRVAWENSGTPVTPAQVSTLRTIIPE